MKIILIVAFSMLSLIGCTADGNGVVNANSKKICLDGVLYHKITGFNSVLGIAVAYNTDGTVKLCEIE